MEFGTERKDKSGFAPFAIRQTARYSYIQEIRESNERKTDAKAAAGSYHGQL